MSGGVDSAVTAYLLKLAGHDVVGVTLKTWISNGGEDSRCCEIDDAKVVAEKLEIPFCVENVVADFCKNVTKPFIDDYLKGMTPNPCVICNRDVKWKHMLNLADNMQADFIATGHYAKIIELANGRFTVKKADFAAKDQTYMLYKLSQEQLKRTLMPLGKLSKDEVRKIAESAKLPVASKPDSEDICFVTDGKYTDFIEENAENYEPKPGNFVDEEGNVLGPNKGIIYYTVGQRKGLGIALGHPAYVKKICPDTNEVVLTDNEALFSNELICTDVNFMSIEGLKPGEELEVRAKIRYHHEPQSAVIKMQEDGNVRVTFHDKVRAITPGQSTVFYDEDDCVVGGGIIVEGL